MKAMKAVKYNFVKFVGLWVMAVLFLTPVSSMARVIQVPHSAWSLQEAVYLANHGDVIELSDGVFSGPTNAKIYLHNKVVTIRSMNGPDHTIIDFQNRKGFRISGGLVTFEGVTFSNASSEGAAGAAVEILQDAEVTFRDCRFTDNRAEEGGAVASQADAPLVFVDCKLSVITLKAAGGRFLSIPMLR
jgi:hypothetical protein